LIIFLAAGFFAIFFIADFALDFADVAFFLAVVFAFFITFLGADFFFLDFDLAM
jgi:hypothetical protein